MTKQKWIAKEWCRYELAAIMSTYDNTFAEAKEHIIEMLNEGQYSDELSNAQTKKAMAEIRFMVEAYK